MNGNAAHGGPGAVDRRADASPRRRPLLSQQRLRKLVSQHQGCLSSLAPRQSRALILRTGLGLKHAYSRQQVAKILHLSLPQEGRLEQRAVIGLGAVSTQGRCVNPLPALGSAMRLAARAALSLFTGPALTSPVSAAAPSGVAERSTAPIQSHAAARPKPAASATAPPVRSAGIAAPQQGGFDWILLAILLAAAATTVWLIYSRHRLHLATKTSGTLAKPRARSFGQGAGVFAGAGARSLRRGAETLASAVGLVALRGALRERRRSGHLPKATTSPAPALDRAPLPSGPGPVEARDPRDGTADAIAAFELGAALAQEGDLSGAEAAYRRADELGHPSSATNLGVILEDRGDMVDAEAAYRRADRRGDAAGTFNLGGLLVAKDDLAGAEAAYARAAERGDTDATTNLGRLLEQRGDVAGAKAAYQHGDERGDAAAASNLGRLLEEWGDLEGAEAAYRRAAERGDAEGAFNLGGLLAEKNDYSGAEAAYARADELGHRSGASNLGVLLEQRGDVAGAEAAYRRADQRGDPTGAFNLGALLADRGDLSGAEAAFGRADERGHAKLAEMARTALSHLKGDA